MFFNKEEGGVTLVPSKAQIYLVEMWGPGFIEDGSYGTSLGLTKYNIKLYGPYMVNLVFSNVTVPESPVLDELTT